MKKLTIGLLLAGAIAAVAPPLAAETKSGDRPAQPGSAAPSAHQCADVDESHAQGQKHDCGKGHDEHKGEGKGSGHGEHHHKDNDKPTPPQPSGQRGS